MDKQPAEAASPTINQTQPNITPISSVPAKWGNLRLAGKLIYLDSAVESKKLLMSIQSLDLASGNTPSDLWSVSATGGIPTQITQIQTSDLFATFSPDNEHIAIFGEGGLFVMKPDGSELTLLASNPQGISGTVRWLP